MAVKQVFTGDTKDLEAAYKRLERENLRYRQTLQQTLTSAQRDNLDLIGSFDLSVGGMAKMVTGFLSIKAAVDALRAAHQQYTTDLAAAGEKNKEFFESAGRTSFALNLSPNRVAAFAQQQPYASNVEATTALREVAGAIPEASAERQEQVAGAAAKFAPMTEIASFSRLLGELADAMPDKTGDQLAGMAIMLQQKAGNDADQLTNEGFLRSMKILQSAGVSPERSFGFGVAALQADLPVKLLETIAAAVEDPGEPAKRAGRRLTPEEAAKDRLARTATKEDRFNLLMSDKEVQKAILGNKGAVQFQQVDGLTVPFDTDMEKLAKTTLLDAKRDPVTAQAYAEREAEKNLENAQRDMGKEGSRRRIKALETDAALANTDFVSRWVTKKTIGAGQTASDFEEATGLLSGGAKFIAGLAAPVLRSRGAAGAAVGGALGKPPGNPDAAMQEQNSILKSIESGIRALGGRTPTPNAHSE